MSARSYTGDTCLSDQLASTVTSLASGPSAHGAKPDYSKRGDAYFLKVIQDLPVAIYTTDADGRLTFYNDAAASLWGRHPKLGEDWWCGSWRLFWPDGTPMAHSECPMAVTLKTGKPVRGAEAIAERPDGTRYPFTPYPTPLSDADGNLIGAVNMLVDITERKRNENASQRLAAIIECSDDAIISKDLRGIITSWNPGAERLFGYTADEIIGKPITTLIPQDRIDEEPGIIKRIIAGERVDHYETLRRRKDGSLIDISLCISPIRDEQGKIVGASKIARDNTERKRADERQALLLGEMKHRAGNLAAIISAVAKQSRPKDAPVVDEFVDRFLGRLRAILKAGELSIASSTRTPDVGEIIRSALNPFVGTQGGSRISVTGPSLNVSEQIGGGLALAFHELATNALKYGALSNERGAVSVSWSVAREEGDDLVQIEWREHGGPRVAQPTGNGFGTRVIGSALSSAKKGSVDTEFAPEGLRCKFRFSIASETSKTTR